MMTPELFCRVSSVLDLICTTHLKYVHIDFVCHVFGKKGFGVSNGEKVLPAAACGLLMPFWLRPA